MIPPSWVDLDGEIVPGDQARVSVFNHGFLFGDSVYDVIRTYDGRPSRVADHLDRLDASAAAIGLQIPVDRDTLRTRIERLVGHGGFAESYIRVVVTRGDGAPNIDPSVAGPPHVLIIVMTLPVPPAALYETGVDVVLVGGVRRPSREQIKSGNYLTSVMAKQEASARDAFEGVMLNADGMLAEASTSNVFCVAGTRLLTPPLAAGILEGITRRHILRLAREDGVTVEERPLAPDELTGADEAFLSSTIKEVLAIASVDGRPLPACPGPLTRRLAARYGAWVRADGAAP